MPHVLQIKNIDKVWVIHFPDHKNTKLTRIAEIYLDHHCQVEQVVLSNDAIEEHRLDVLRLAVHHVANFVRHRTSSAMGGLLVGKHTNYELTSADSDALMSFDAIDDSLKHTDYRALVNTLQASRIDVLVAKYHFWQDGLREAVEAVGVPGLICTVSKAREIFGTISVTFEVRGKDKVFEFWKSESKPRRPSTHELYIIPPYHPAMQGMHYEFLVNGATDAMVSGNAIRAVHCPTNQQSQKRDIFGSTWSHVGHPCRVTAKSFEVDILPLHVRTQSGIEEVTRFLRSALRLNDMYVGISGGFQPPMKCPDNRLLEIGRQSPYPNASNERNGHLARGSEAHCVWTYRTLEEEGVLDKAYIPPWFKEEKWLDIYEGAEVRPGIY